jgi:Sterol carrier protein domain
MTSASRQSDNLWLRILDLPSALQARSYESAADLTIAIKADTMCPHNAAVWCLDASPAGTTCSRVEALPDLTIDVNSLASLYLGGMSASLLAGAGRIRPHRETAVVGGVQRCQDAAVGRFDIRRESSTWASLLIMEAAGRRRGGAARMGHGPGAPRGRDCAVADDRGRARLVRRDVRCGPRFGIVTEYAMSAAAAGPAMI